MRSRSLWAAVVAALLLGAAGCAPRERTPLRVLFAGSLMLPFQAVEQAYESRHPDIDVQMEGHGSIQVIRHVTEIHDLADVVASADQALIPLLMYQSQDPETGRPYADWYVEFATNRLALAYTPSSHYADEISPDNWFEILAHPDVTLGLADPRFDAAGYRALMVLQLAESVYNRPTLFEDLTLGRFRYPITVGEDDGVAVVRVPEIVETKSDAGIVVRGASIALLALLESGDLDYAFEYESVIRQHALQFVPLPDSLNLGSEAYAAQYHRVRIELDFQRFASVQPVFEGDVIGYGVTIPTNAPHPDLAVDFVAFLLGPEGQAVLEANSQPVLTPPRADHFEALPEILQPLCVPMP
jgi:molybdate/tungstate transport system substrate-binding protein